MEHTNKNTLVIIDSMFIAHWSSYPIESRQYNGVPTTVIYSMLKSLIDIKKEFPVDSHFLFTWDSSSYFRKEFFPGYKLRGYDKDEASLKERKEFIEQCRILRNEVLPAMGFNNQILITGYEADDIIACYSAWGAINYKQVHIVSIDKDMYQLLLKNVNMYHPGKSTYYGIDNFIDDYKIHPKLWVRVKAIAGCTSDTIPGVFQVGEPTAIKFLKKEKVREVLKDRIKSFILSSDYKRNIRLVSLPWDNHNLVAPVAVNQLKPFTLNKEGFNFVRSKYGIKTLEAWLSS